MAIGVIVNSANDNNQAKQDFSQVNCKQPRVFEQHRSPPQRCRVVAYTHAHTYRVAQKTGPAYLIANILKTP